MTVDELAAAVDRARLMEHMEVFAKRVKLSGTAPELESFRYLESCMAEFGFRTTLLSHDAFISLPGRARVEVDGRALPCITHSMSRATGAGGITAELCYVGEGEDGDFARREVAGRVVLIDGIAMDEVAYRASRAGAVGQIHISPNEHVYEMCVSPVWGSPSQHSRVHLPATVVCSIAAEEGAALRARCLAGEFFTVALETEVDTGWRKTPILVADLDSVDAEAPFILFSGHHDTWHYGVMDNGGANATMLEVSRLLAGEQARLRRGLRVCFWSGHSHGRYSGSAWYADEYFAELDRRCAAHVNVDSTGGAGATVLTRSGTVDELKGLAFAEIAAVTGQQHEGRRQGRNADQSFWGIGIPSMFGSLSHQPPGPHKMPTALGWWWHTPHDLIEHIDPDNLVRDTRIALRVVARLLTERVLPLDYAVYAEALERELRDLAEALGPRMDIGGLQSAAAALRVNAQHLARSAADADEPAARLLDQVLLQASRALVPINYTSGNRFHPDLALSQGAWPALDGLRELARLPRESAETPFYAVHARRTRNLVAHALAAANKALSFGGDTSC